MAKYFKRYIINGDYANIIHFKRMKSDVEKRLFTDEWGTSVDVLKVEDSPQRKMWLLYRLTPTRKGKSAFIKCDIISKISYRKDSKKYFYLNKDMLTSSEKIRKILGIEFLNNLQSTDIVTKTILKGIFNKKITNSNEVVKRYFASLGFRNIPTDKFIKSGHNPKYLLSFLYNSTNAESTLDYLLTANREELSRKLEIFRDLQKEANILGKSTDIRWSLNRMREEHSAWTKEIAALKLKTMRYQKVKYTMQPPILEGVELLDDNIKVYEEGRIMNHCIYSANYFKQVLEKRDILLRYERKGVRGTAQISYKGAKDEVIINQFRGYKNNDVPKEHVEYLRQSINSEAFKSFCKTELRNIHNPVEANWLPF